MTHNHITLVKRGLELHEARKYALALPYFERAQRMAPHCPTALYNRANTLHMLKRNRRAFRLFKKLIETPIDELQSACADSWPRSLQMDAYFVLFFVVLDSGGLWKHAFAYAKEHLKRRKRGLKSAWTLRQIRKEIADHRRTWEAAKVITSPPPHSQFPYTTPIGGV